MNILGCVYTRVLYYPRNKTLLSRLQHLSQSQSRLLSGNSRVIQIKMGISRHDNMKYYVQIIKISVIQTKEKYEEYRRRGMKIKTIYHHKVATCFVVDKKKHLFPI